MPLALKNSGNTGDDTILQNCLQEKLIEFCELAKNWGFELTPYSKITWIKYASMPSLTQQKIYDDFCIYYDLCASAAAEGIGLNDDRMLVWHALKSLKMRPPADLMSRISAGDVIEIYNADHIQIFRNLRFFEISSYSIGDIFVHTWQDLYSRSEACLKETIKEIGEMLNGECVNSKSVDHMLTQNLEELFSENLHLLELKPNYMAPLADKAHCIGYIIGSTVKIIGSKRDEVQAPPRTHLSLLEI